ncbi:MAG: cyclophilin-like fold protein [archaeon GB-1867-005]|nr:cyclophilin-like fold protein [Candidatus Culexmicrobium cathedralense]
MALRLKIEFEGVGSVIVKLVEEWGPKTIEKLIEALPIESTANRWGDEVYFEVGVEAAEENSRVDMEVGEVAYWPPGNALCIFFGPTPVSVTEKPRAYSPVNPVGIVEEGIEVLRKVNGGEKVRVELIS